MNDTTQTVDTTYLMTKAFYFIVENTDSYGYSGSTLRPDDKYHVEVAIYRLDEEGKKIDVVKGIQDPVRVVRSWITGTPERVSFVQRVPSPNGDKTSPPPNFSDEGMQPFPGEGFPGNKMPILVVAEVPDLEGQREHVAFARIFDGNQWGLWAKIPQACMKIVDEHDKPLQDVRVSRLKPKITAQIKDKDQLRIPRDKAGDPIVIHCEVEDYVDIKNVYVNGAEPIDPAKISQKQQDGRYKVAFDYSVPPGDGYKRIEIIADNAVGGRSQVIKLYQPEYSQESKDRGKVLAYVTDIANFERETDPEPPQLFRIVFHAIPYRLPSALNRGADRSDKKTPSLLTAGLLLGKKGSFPVELQQKACMPEKRPEDQQPYLGPDVPLPEQIKLDKKKRSHAPMKVIIDTRIKQTGSGTSKKYVLDYAETALSIDERDWTWASELLVLIPGSKRIGNAIPAELGDLLQTYVNVRWKSYSATGSQGYGDYRAAFDDHFRILSCKTAAAGVRPIGKESKQPLPALKNGDVIRVDAFTIKAQPAALVNARSEHNHKGDNEAESPFKLYGNYPQETDQVAEPLKELQACLRNINDEGVRDEARRDEPEVPTVTTLDFDRELIEQEAAESDQNSESPEGDSSEASTSRKSDEAEKKDSDSSTEPAPKPPGRMKYRLVSVPKQLVRLLTQEYLDSKTIRARNTEKRHQILPFGFFSIEVVKKNAKADDKPAIQDSFRTLEITKRWYVDDKPSVQPALAGSNLRAGGPGHHRVQGLGHKLRDGSIYVHNGELFQAAEDLHASGKVMDLRLRRTYLSHSLFTSDLGRNWDWIGNMRLIELLNGEVHLLNGESQIEAYPPKQGTDTKPIDVTAIKKGEFNYASIFDQRQYDSPSGAYRSLVKAKPVVLGGAKDVAAPKSEEARFYLVDKHGTIWTFVEDMRFHEAASGQKPADKDADAQEPAPGVRAHWLLVSIHDRRQGNSIRLQRDGSGLACALIDDYGRVTQIKRKFKPKGGVSAVTVTDFAGRSITYDTEQDGNLAKTTGPVIGERQHQYKYGYADKTTTGEGPRHRLCEVHDPLSNALTAQTKNADKAFLAIEQWDRQGRVKKQVQQNRFVPVDLGSKSADSKWNLPPDGLSNRVEYTLTYMGTASTTRSAVTDVRQFEAGGKKEDHRESVSSYKIKKQADRPFCEIISESTHAGGLLRQIFGLIGMPVPNGKTTKYTYDSQGEVTKKENPLGDFEVWTYEETGSGLGNLKSRESFDSAKESISREEYKYNPLADSESRQRAANIRANMIKLPVSVRRSLADFLKTYQETLESNPPGNGFNLPNRVTRRTFVKDNEPSEAATATEYDEEGSAWWITEPVAAIFDEQLRPHIPPEDVCSIIRRTYRPDDGLLSREISKRNVITEYGYYAPAAPGQHVAGDAHDSAGMLGVERVNPIGELPGDWQTNDSAGCTTREKIDFKKEIQIAISEATHYPNGFLTKYRRNVLGLVKLTINCDDEKDISEFNDLGQVTKDAKSDEYEYDDNSYITKIRGLMDQESKSAGATPATDNDKVTRAVMVNDSMGELVARYVPDVRVDNLTKMTVGHRSDYDAKGHVIRSIDEKGVESRFVYDMRGNLSWSCRDVSGQKATDTYEHNANDRIIFHKDACGWCEAWRYDKGGRLTHYMDSRGLITETVYGHGSLVHQERKFEPVALKSARASAATNDAAWKEKLRAVAKSFANDPLQMDALLSESTFHRDERSRTYNVVRTVITPGKEEKGKSIVRSAWTLDDLLCVKQVDNGPQIIVRYDAFARQTQSEGNGTDPVSQSYDGPNITEINSPASSMVYVFTDRRRHQYLIRSGLLTVIGEHREYNVLGQLISLTADNNRKNETLKYDNLGRLYDRRVSESSGQAPYFALEVANLPQNNFNRMYFSDFDIYGRLVKVREWFWEPAQGARMPWHDPSEIDPPPPLNRLDQYRFARGEITLQALTARLDVPLKPAGFVEVIAKECIYFSNDPIDWDYSELKEYGRTVFRNAKYDARGHRISWGNFNVDYEARLDGAGETLALTARSRFDRKDMLKQYFTRDALGRLTETEHRQLAYFDSNSHLVLGEEPAVYNTFVYDTLNRQIRSTQAIGEEEKKLPLSFEQEQTTTGVLKSFKYPTIGKASGAEYSLDTQERHIGLSVTEPSGQKRKYLKSVEYSNIDGLPCRIETHGLSTVDPRPYTLAGGIKTPILLIPEDKENWLEIVRETEYPKYPFSDITDKSYPTFWGGQIGVKRRRAHNIYWNEGQDILKQTDRVTTVGINKLMPTEYPWPARVVETKLFVQTPNGQGESNVTRSDIKTYEYEKTEDVPEDKLEAGKLKQTQENSSLTIRNGAGHVLASAEGSGNDNGGRMSRTWLINSYKFQQSHVAQWEKVLSKFKEEVCVNEQQKLVHSKSYNLQPQPLYYQEDATCINPETWSSHDALLRPVKIENPWTADNSYEDLVRAPRQSCAMRYDAMGRLIEKTIPAMLTINRDLDAVRKFSAYGRHTFPLADSGVMSRITHTAGGLDETLREVDQEPYFSQRKCVIEFKDVVCTESELGERLSYRGRWGEMVFVIKHESMVARNGKPITFNTTARMTIRGVKFSEPVTLIDCEDLTFDNCEFYGGITIKKKADRVHIINCVITAGVNLEELTETCSICIAHNLIQIFIEDREAVKVGFKLKWQNEVHAYNNVIIHHDVRSKYVRAILEERSNFSVDDCCNHFVRRADYERPVSSTGYNADEAFEKARKEAEAGITFLGKGTADTPPSAYGLKPVLWDRKGVIRDAKYPCPGPVELLPAGRSATVTHRYFWNDQTLVMRAVYWNKPKLASSGADAITRYLDAIPGHGGIQFLMDDDDRVDAKVMDHFGGMWYTQRLREGKNQLGSLAGVRGRALIQPLDLPGSLYFNFSPFHAAALDRDFLYGSRGILGWNRNSQRDEYLRLTGVAPPPARELSDWEKFLLNLWNNPWETLGYVLAGALVVIGGVIVGILLPGPLGLMLGGGMVSAGWNFAITGAVENDFKKALKDAGIGFVTGAIGALAGYGAAGFVAKAIGFGARATPALKLAERFGSKEVQVLLGGVKKITDGYVSGAIQDTWSNLDEGKSWSESLAKGLGAGLTGLPATIFQDAVNSRIERRIEPRVSQSRVGQWFKKRIR